MSPYSESFYDLDIMENNQSLSGVTAKIVEKFDPLVKREKPDWILVQGDRATFLTLTELEGSLRSLTVEV